MRVDDSAAQWLELFTTTMFEVDTIRQGTADKAWGALDDGEGGGLVAGLRLKLSVAVHVMAAQVVFKQTSVVASGTWYTALVIGCQCFSVSPARWEQ